MKIKLKGIKIVKKRLATGGIEVYYYHRKSGKRIDGQPNSAEFVANYNRLNTYIHNTTGSFKDLIVRFETSPTFDGLAKATRDAYGWKLKAVTKKWGTCPTEAVQDLEFRKDALVWRDEIAKTSRHSADDLLAAVARVLSLAKENGDIKVNVLDTFKRVYKSDRSEIVWSDGQVEKFLTVARPSMRLAMYLVRNLGLRQKDIRELPWSAYDGSTVALRTSKTKAPIKTPCSQELKSYLDKLPRDGVLMLQTPRKHAFTKSHFGKYWREDCIKAGIEGLHFHDLRGTAAAALAGAGANVPMIASIMGWSHDTAQKMMDTYVPQSSSLAARGIELLEAHRAKKDTPGTKNHS